MKMPRHYWRYISMRCRQADRETASLLWSCFLGRVCSDGNSYVQVTLTSEHQHWQLEGSALSLPFDDHSFDLVFCQLGLQFFSDGALALREMKRVLRLSGRVALSVYSAMERTPAANAFAIALDQRLGPDASKIKRAE